jgi:hypothetical protein
VHAGHPMNTEKQETRAWHSERSSFAGWEQESGLPSWQEYVAEPTRPGMDDLLMPKTVAALRLCDGWLRAALRADAGDADEELIGAIAEARRIREAATRKLSAALDRLLAGAEFAPPPVLQSHLDAADQLIERIAHWFGLAPQRDRYTARARAVRGYLAHELAGQRAERLTLYRKLSAEAAAAWPEIERKLPFEEGFDPTDLGAWRGRTIRLAGVLNRVGSDFVGPYQFATAVKGVAVAGNYEQRVAGAVQATQRRTHRVLDARVPWDLIAIVEGEGAIHQRNAKRLNVMGSREALTVETWDPAPCVTIRIIALHAGPVAFGSG